MSYKYHNQPTVVNGIRFDSKKEARRYDELLLLLRAGEISDLRLQQNVTLIEGYKTPDGEIVRPEIYKADFAYRDKWGNRVLEDVKGKKTQAYLIKRKQVQDKLGIRIREIF